MLVVLPLGILGAYWIQNQCYIRSCNFMLRLVMLVKLCSETCFNLLLGGVGPSPSLLSLWFSSF